VIGWVRYYLVFLLGALMSGAVYALLAPPYSCCSGASGVLCCLMGLWIIVLPWGRLEAGPSSGTRSVSVPLIVFPLLFFLKDMVQFYGGFGGGIAFSLHWSGFLAGVLMGCFLKAQQVLKGNAAIRFRRSSSLT